MPVNKNYKNTTTLLHIIICKKINLDKKTFDINDMQNHYFLILGIIRMFSLNCQ